jgi:hypothetical protein
MRRNRLHILQTICFVQPFTLFFEVRTVHGTPQSLGGKWVTVLHAKVCICGSVASSSCQAPLLHLTYLYAHCRYTTLPAVLLPRIAGLLSHTNYKQALKQRPDSTVGLLCWAFPLSPLQVAVTLPFCTSPQLFMPIRRKRV